jgi:hypothetical protein
MLSVTDGSPHCLRTASASRTSQGNWNTDADLVSRLPAKTETMDTDAVRPIVNADDKQPYINLI